jgi:hypothetical protein
VQKTIEDKTKIHGQRGFSWPTWFHDFNNPDSGIISLHSLDPDDSSAEFNFGQLAMTRPSEGWFVPGFGLKLDVGRAGEAIKSDWNGDGGVDRGRHLREEQLRRRGGVPHVDRCRTIPRRSRASR